MAASGVRQELRNWVTQWAELDNLIKDGNASRGNIDAWEEERRRLRRIIMERLRDRPKLIDEAQKWGFTYEGVAELKENRQEGGGGDDDRLQGPPNPDKPEQQGQYGAGEEPPDAVGEVVDNAPDRVGGARGGGNNNKPNLGAQAADNRLLGEKGQHYVIRRTAKGGYLAVYSFRIAGEVKRIAIQIPRDRLEKYGVKRGEGKTLTDSQLKNIQNIGWADELAPHIRKGDGQVVKSLVRYLRNQYGGQPILENDEVMGVIIANSLLGWTAGEFENQLRNTKWYSNTNEYQRQWQTVTSTKEKRQTINNTLQQVVNTLEDTYGLDWVKHVDGGMRLAKEWANKIASGAWGTPDEGLQFWGERQSDKAAGIEGTPAWILRQKEVEEQRAYSNRPEDMFETLRSQAMSYLGQVNGRPLIDRDTLMSWATDLVTENKSDADWQQFLRQQMRSLHPYFDENLSFTEQASPYKSVAESLLGTSLTWDDPLMMKIAGTDDKGQSTGQTMALHEYSQWIRDNDDRFWDNPDTTKRIDSFGAEVLNRMLGVA